MSVRPGEWGAGTRRETKPISSAMVDLSPGSSRGDDVPAEWLRPWFLFMRISRKKKKKKKKKERKLRTTETQR